MCACYDASCRQGKTHPWRRTATAARSSRSLHSVSSSFCGLPRTPGLEPRERQGLARANPQNWRKESYWDRTWFFASSPHLQGTKVVRPSMWDFCSRGTGGRPLVNRLASTGSREVLHKQRPIAESLLAYGSLWKGGQLRSAYSTVPRHCMAATQLVLARAYR